METTLFTFLVTAAFWAHVRTEGRSPWVGVIAALAALTRPEGWLLGGLLAADAVRLQGRRGLKVGAAFAAIFVPYFVWRTVYYGYLLPNTFYAKVGSTFDQVARGWVYLKVFLWNWGLCLFAAAPIAVVMVGWKRLLGLFTFLSLYTAYVVSVGGDVFHFFRFWAPIVPVLCALAYSGFLGIFLRTRIGNDRLAVAAIGLTMALWLALATRALVQRQLEHVKTANGLLRLVQHICGCIVRNTKPDDRIAALGIGLLKWCSNRPVIDMLGLTDLHIARKSALPMGKGLAGHEKYDSTYVLSLKPKYIQVGPLTGRRSPVLPAEQDMWQQPEFLRMYERDECGYRREDDVPEAKK